MARRFRFRVLLPLLPLVPLAAAVALIVTESRRLDWSEVRAAITALPSDRLPLAIALTVLSFALLTGYDGLGARFAGKRIPYRRTALASFLGFSVSQSLGFPVATGIPIRYRLYAAWGLDTETIQAILAFYLATFWISSVAMTGLVLLVEPGELLPLAHLPAGAGRPVGAIIAILTVTYLAWASLPNRELKLWRWRVESPGLALAASQVALGVLDWTISAGVLYVLLPPGPELPAYPTFVGMFLLSQLAGQVSHVPGGLGVFEATIMVLMPNEVASGGVLASLLVYRVVYYLGPLVAGVCTLGAYEAWNRRRGLERARSVAARAAAVIVPPMMAVGVFTAGVILLVSGAVPAVGGRLAALERFVPLVFVELSHFVASLVGAYLLVLAWAIQRRLQVAYHITLGLLATGAVLSLMKGLDYEEAIVLTVMALALLVSGRQFYRSSSLLGEPLTVGWAAAVLGAVIGAVGLVFIAHRDPLVGGDVWWRFEWRAEAPRSLRGTVGALSLLGVLGAVKLLSPATPRRDVPTGSDLAEAKSVALSSRRSYAQLVLLGDKQLLFDRTRRAFIMFATHGRSWIAMGDPVGDEDAAAELVWDFRALADRHADWAVFYQVVPERLPLYLDLGLTITKLGEEARVPLGDFSLEGGQRKGLRRTMRLVEKAGTTFRVMAGSELAAAMPQLRSISDEWLARKHTREKGFSLGSFSREYLLQTPVAVLERDGRVVAFANVQEGAERYEATVDLMRYGSAAPPNSMEYLLTRAILWEKERGFQWFSLGMAPLSGLEARPLAPLWAHLAAALYRHGEHLYPFEGLREYKEGFDPVWEPRYLASPGGTALPRVLANVTTLIAGGLGGVVHR